MRLSIIYSIWGGTWSKRSITETSGKVRLDVGQRQRPDNWW
jgi:hypothetical protein